MTIYIRKIPAKISFIYWHQSDNPSHTKRIERDAVTVKNVTQVQKSVVNAPSFILFIYRVMLRLGLLSKTFCVS